MLSVSQRVFSRCISKHTNHELRNWIHSLSLPRSPSENRTIFALSTPPGKGGVAVIRVSGPDAATVWERVVRPVSPRVGRIESLQRPRSRSMYRCRVLDTNTQQYLDDGLAVFFQAPNSYTTEPSMELHLHSSPATLRRVLALLSCIPGVRPAEKGEFTKRACLAGRINLLQAEGLRDLIEAETEVQRKIAWEAFGGSISAKMNIFREQIVNALAMVEALIDFGEGESIEEGVYDEARERIERLRDTIKSHINDGRRGEILRSGIRISIFGPPNAGKSSLLNYLVQREAAIVTPIPGTTRDVLETSLDLVGIPVKLSDTAGIRHTENLVEKIGIERAQKAVYEADMSLCVLSLPQLLEDKEIPPSVKPLFTPATLVLLNKKDLATADVRIPTVGMKTWTGSLVTGEGMSDFVRDLGGLLKERYDFHSEQAPLVTQNRHRIHLQRSLEFLDAFLRCPRSDVVLAAEDLRYAAQEIGMITGGVGVEDVLDAVFATFCIGK